jgi:hypothetical protein
MTPGYVWAFDGVGGAAAVAAGVAVYQRYSARKRPKIEAPTVTAQAHSLAVVESPGSLILAAPVTDSPVAVGSNISQTVEVHHHHGMTDNPNEWTPTEPTPSGIMQEIAATLPFDQEHAREKYIALSVRWATSLVKVVRREKNWYVITLFPPNDDDCGIYVSFDLFSVTPELKSATIGSLLQVAGTIESVGSRVQGIDLEADPKIRVVKRA